MSTTYLGMINMTRLDRIKVEEKFPISEQGYTVGKLLDNMECQIWEQVNYLCLNYII